MSIAQQIASGILVLIAVWWLLVESAFFIIDIYISYEKEKENKKKKKKPMTKIHTRIIKRTPDKFYVAYRTKSVDKALAQARSSDKVSTVNVKCFAESGALTPIEADGGEDIIMPFDGVILIIYPKQNKEK